MNTDAKTMLEIKDLHVYYDNIHALKGVSLKVKEGEIVSLIGANGAGKTTLMKTLATLLEKQKGEIRICGIPVEETARVRKMIGYLPQDFSMYPNMTVYEAMDYLGVLSGMSKEKRKQRIPVLLEQVNLQNDSRKKVRALSGGMRRRLGIAQAILHDPKVLIVDEPTAGLDPEERVRFRNLLCEIAEKRIVILSTHIVGDIEATCENLAVMDQGKILYHGTVETLIELAKDKVYTAEISKKELPVMKENYLVTGMLSVGNNVSVRFLSEKKPFDGAKPCSAGVEDAYLYLMEEKAGGNNVL